jgi:sulfur carrier protein
MRLNINGETKDNIGASTLKELLEELGIISGRVAVEVNAAIVKRAEYDTFRLKDGDVLEIVNFVGGGQ